MSTCAALSPPTGTNTNTGQALQLASLLIAKNVLEHGDNGSKTRMVEVIEGPIERCMADPDFMRRVLDRARKQFGTKQPARTSRAVFIRGRSTRTGRATTARRAAAHKSSTRSIAGSDAGSDKPGEPPGPGSRKVEPTAVAATGAVPRFVRVLTPGVAA